MLAALDAMAARHEANPAQVALAWVAAQPGLTGPIASATTAAQVVDLVAAANLRMICRNSATPRHDVPANPAAALKKPL